MNNPGWDDSTRGFKLELLLKGLGILQNWRPARIWCLLASNGRWRIIGNVSRQVTACRTSLR